MGSVSSVEIRLILIVWNGETTNALCGNTSAHSNDKTPSALPDDETTSAIINL